MADDSSMALATQPLSFALFLEKMKEPRAQDLVRAIKIFIKGFEDRKPDPDRDSAEVQDFLSKMEIAFREHEVWAKAPADHQTQAVEGLEKYLMTRIHHRVFAISAMDKERDEALGLRISALSFVRPEHLDIPTVLRDSQAWVLAMKEIHKINDYKAPRDKLVCILNCCRVINNLLHAAVQHGEAKGADDFLPVLIYVVIQANPPNLISNLEYIQRFRMQSHMAAEFAYFFTQLYSAASFIETINTASLTMDPDEFVARMVAAGVPDMQLLPQPGSPKAAALGQQASQPQPEHSQVASNSPIPASPLASPSAATTSHNLPPLAPNVAVAHAGRFPAVHELEREGVPLVVAADVAGHLLQRHRFIYAAASDLRVADVAALLELVLRYEALSRAVSQHSAGRAEVASPAGLSAGGRQNSQAAPFRTPQGQRAAAPTASSSSAQHVEQLALVQPDHGHVSAPPAREDIDAADGAATTHGRSVSDIAASMFGVGPSAAGMHAAHMPAMAGQVSVPPAAPPQAGAVTAPSLPEWLASQKAGSPGGRALPSSLQSPERPSRTASAASGLSGISAPSARNVVSESLDVPESSTAPSGSMLPPAISATSLLEAPPPPVSMAASPSPRPPTPPAEPLIAGSPFGHHSMQNRPDSHPPPAAQAAGDALGQPKASGDRWDYQLPLASPFSSQPGLAFPQPSAPKRAALAEPEPGRVSREDIAALASGSPAAQGHDADAHTIESKHPQRPAAHQSDATPPVGEDAVGSSSLI